MKDKFALYESAGVREYWIIDPVREHVLVYVMAETGKFVGKQPFYAGDQIPSEVLVGFVLDTTEILLELDDE
jgi:Uma2 family endonuclease